MCSKSGLIPSRSVGLALWTFASSTDPWCIDREVPLAAFNLSKCTKKATVLDCSHVRKKGE